MTNDIYSIIERLAILEGRIAPKDSKPITETKQKKPALFNNLKKTDEMFMPSVGGVEMAEDNMEEDVLSKVKASLADYLQSAEAEINQDRDLLAKKKQDLDLKKRELRDLALQTKPNHQSKDSLKEFVPSDGGDDGNDGFDEDTLKRLAAQWYNGDEDPAVERTLMAAGWEIGQDEGYEDEPGVFVVMSGDEHGKTYISWPAEELRQNIDEEPNQTPAGGEAPSGLSNPTYAESIGSAPVKTVHVPVDEEVGLSGGGGAVLVEIHGDERDGFRICRAGKELPTRFRTLEECEMALEMYMARRKAQHVADESADYIEEA